MTIKVDLLPSERRPERNKATFFDKLVTTVFAVGTVLTGCAAAVL